MDQQQQAQLIAYIQQQLQRGDSEDTIRATLQQYKWNDEVISNMLAEAKSTMPVDTPSQLQQATATELASNTNPEAPLTSSEEMTDNQQSQPVTEPEADAVTVNAQAQNAATAPAQIVDSGKYGVFQSVGEFFNTVKRAPKTFIIAVVIGYGVGLALLAVFALILMGLVIGGIVRSGGISSYMTYLPLLIVGFLLMNVVATASSAFNISITSLALMDVAEGRLRPIGQVLRSALQQLLRVIVSYIVFWIVIFGPLLIVAVVGMIVTITGLANGVGAILLYLLGIASLAWGLIAALRYPLIPYIALFDPGVRYGQLPRRSFQLMKSGGQWFIFKGILLIMAVTIILSIITESLLGETAIGTILSSVIFAAISVIANGVMVMLYRRRRMIVG